jgi:hypothetical protein
MANSKTMILVRPRADRVTESTHEWASVIKKQFEAQGWQVCDLGENLAITTQVESTLQTVNSTVFVFYGHGTKDGCNMLGQNDDHLIHLGNVNLLQNQIVYTVACWTAKTLGKTAEHFVRCYYGYDEELLFSLYEDHLKKLGECVNAGLFEMLKGGTSEQARQRVVAEYTRWIDYFTTGEGNVGPVCAIFAASLVYNRDALRLFGDTTAKF